MRHTSKTHAEARRQEACDVFRKTARVMKMLILMLSASAASAAPVGVMAAKAVGTRSCVRLLSASIGLLAKMFVVRLSCSNSSGLPSPSPVSELSWSPTSEDVR